MHNFTYYNPVKILFGAGSISKIKNQIPANSNVLFAYGGGSIKQNGVYEQAMAQLTECNVIEFAGIEANPDYDTLMKAVAICKEKKVDFILAVGGGSIIDGCKFIALAAHYEGDPWEILTKPDHVATKAIPLGTILTLPATGSEMNCGAVISRRSLGTKLAFGNPLVYPVFSVLDPLATLTLPTRQLQNGIVDPFIHVTEQYLTTDLNSEIQDGYAETVLRTLIKVGKDIVDGATDYDTRANWMWAATNALNGILGIGVDHDWAAHMIGHELTAETGLDHGQTLAIAAPQVWRYQRDAKHEKLVKFARNVWGLNNLDKNDLIDKAISLTEEFFHSLGVKTKLSDYGISVDKELFIANLFKYNPPLGENKAIDSEAMLEILYNMH